MKKLFVIILLMVYGVASSGMTLHFHYCCGKLDKIDLSPVKHKGCGTDHKLGKRSCCDNKEVTLDIKSDQSPVKHVNLLFQPFVIQETGTNFLITGAGQTRNILPQIFAPPPLQKDVNSLFCVYRI